MCGRLQVLRDYASTSKQHQLQHAAHFQQLVTKAAAGQLLSQTALPTDQPASVPCTGHKSTALQTSTISQPAFGESPPWSAAPSTPLPQQSAPQTFPGSAATAGLRRLRPLAKKLSSSDATVHFAEAASGQLLNAERPASVTCSKPVPFTAEATVNVQHSQPGKPESEGMSSTEAMWARLRSSATLPAPGVASSGSTTAGWAEEHPSASEMTPSRRVSDLGMPPGFPELTPSRYISNLDAPPRFPELTPSRRSPDLDTPPGFPVSGLNPGPPASQHSAAASSGGGLSAADMWVTPGFPSSGLVPGLLVSQRLAAASPGRGLAVTDMLPPPGFPDLDLLFPLQQLSPPGLQPASAPASPTFASASPPLASALPPLSSALPPLASASSPLSEAASHQSWAASPDNFSGTSKLSVAACIASASFLPSEAELLHPTPISAEQPSLTARASSAQQKANGSVKERARSSSYVATGKPLSHSALCRLLDPGIPTYDEELAICWRVRHLLHGVPSVCHLTATSHLPHDVSCHFGGTRLSFCR